MRPMIPDASEYWDGAAVLLGKCEPKIATKSWGGGGGQVEVLIPGKGASHQVLSATLLGEERVVVWGGSMGVHLAWEGASYQVLSPMAPANGAVNWLAAAPQHT